MVRVRNQANTSTLIGFNDSTIILLNKESMMESAEFETTPQDRYGMKSIIQRKTGLKNKKLHMKVAFIGSNRNTDFNTLMSALENNEFVYLDTESLQTRLDGVYAPFGQLTQKKDEGDETIIVDFDLIEKED